MVHRLSYEVHNCSSNNKVTALRQPYFHTFITTFAADFMTGHLHLSTLSKLTAEYILECYGYHTGRMSEICEYIFYNYCSTHELLQCVIRQFAMSSAISPPS